MYHFEKKDFKESWNLWKKKKWVFLKMSLGSSMPLVQRFFSFENFSLSLGKIWKSLIFFLIFIFLIYIHKQSSLNTTWNFWIQKNIETWNKQTNFKLNHDIANQMWSEAKLGHLLLLGPFRMLEAWCAWT